MIAYKKYKTLVVSRRVLLLHCCFGLQKSYGYSNQGSENLLHGYIGCVKKLRTVRN